MKTFIVTVAAAAFVVGGVGVKAQSQR